MNDPSHHHPSYSPCSAYPTLGPSPLRLRLPLRPSQRRSFSLFACSADPNPGSQEIVPRHRVGNPPILLHREIMQMPLLHRLHGFFNRGFSSDTDSLTNHD